MMWVALFAALSACASPTPFPSLPIPVTPPSVVPGPVEAPAATPVVRAPAPDPYGRQVYPSSPERLLLLEAVHQEIVRKLESGQPLLPSRAADGTLIIPEAGGGA